jgi:hypothetical protein
MRTHRFSGRLIGLLAAYGVAAQVMLLPLSLPPAPAFAASLCRSDDGGAPAQPAGHDHGGPCCAGCGLQCHVPALAGDPQVAQPAAPRLRVGAILAPAPFEPAVRSSLRTPQVPRGPPAA